MQIITILYLFKCLDRRKLKFWIQVGRQILSWIQNPKKQQKKKKKKKVKPITAYMLLNGL